MIEKSVIIQNKEGMHMRPSGEFAKIASKCSSEVTIIYNGNNINAKSVLNIMSAGIKSGEEFIIRCNGDNEEEDLKTLVQAVESGLGE